MDTAILWPAPSVRARWEQIMALLAVSPGESILDVGCGRGAPLRYLTHQVGSAGLVVGVDRPAEGMLPLRDTIGRHGLGNAAIVAGSAESLPFADGSFDAVLCVNVLEAVPDRAGALRELRRVLKPGGRALVAHDDYDSQVYTSTDRALGRRVALAYADSTFASYATSDGQMGRHLWPLFVAAGFVEPRLHVLPLVETEYA